MTIEFAKIGPLHFSNRYKSVTLRIKNFEDMRLVGVLVFLFLIINGFSQNTINQVDGMGKKQGLWMKRDADGKLIYQATFKDDKPVGEMKRFHPNGKTKAVLKFTEASNESDAQLFDERGNLIAEGKYVDQKKSGKWNYLVNSKIVLTENYQNGLKEGTSNRFYTTGELLEESNWQADKLNGAYRTYFQDGKVLLECNYTDGRRNGKFISRFPNGFPEIDGTYYDDVRDQEWNYYDSEGNLRYTLKFGLGKLLNPEVQDSIDHARTDVYKTKDDHVPDPEKFLQNPEEYMRLMRIQ